MGALSDSSSRLSGRRVLVIGASSGVGRAAGEAAAREGARVAFAARRVERIEEAARAAGSGALAVTCDGADESSLEAAVERTVQAFGGLDALVYAPGIAVFQPLAQIDARRARLGPTRFVSSTWRQVFASIWARGWKTAMPGA